MWTLCAEELGTCFLWLSKENIKYGWV